MRSTDSTATNRPKEWCITTVPINLNIVVWHEGLPTAYISSGSDHYLQKTYQKEEKKLNEEEINLLIKKRNEARKSKDFDLADNIRKKLIAMGIEIKDQSKETIWKKV